ncbi:ATPase, T2SS/T4P/T4SS family [Halorientalis regularis]|uniref:Type IV secretory pathway ATPase VirB11/Archaellum biosynthesis ATPase n=1 Tax=Halorientalis regularis TaxID=660518 RepID=A0A1G7IVK7_9EURY|nr:ATPase, T2SS/T4P/T4SS family [Halorientalis regularis]SDF16626.1 Type IV secretory pathway ATPase VirB11/Archaellum biosynthesis ATPase [Halorientalis regularis]
MGVLSRVRGGDDETGCRCTPSFDDDRLVIDAGDCPGGGLLATEPTCRAAVVDALCERDADAICTRAAGVERAYEGAAAATLVAAGRFADAAAFHDEAIADRARRDPLGAARAATGRAGPVATLAAETGLAEVATQAGGYEELLAPAVGPTISRSRVRLQPPATARFASRENLETGAVARIYAEPDRERRLYHLEPVEHGFGRAATERLVTAYDRLASGAVTGGERAPGRAVRRVVDDESALDATVGELERVLEKHTQGHGVLTDLFADERVTDVFVTAPAASNRIRVRVDGETLTTNVRLTEGGIEALASRFRRESGRAFSRASPALDATATVADRRVRVAGVTEPVSDGIAFTFRAHERQAWTLPALIDNGTLTANAAALLSLAVERDAATLLAGTRGAGKTTMLGALLWELSAEIRTVVIEDTPELPVGQLQAAGRDVQSLRTGDDDSGALAPAEALRTALRLGEGALVVGEVRGEEAGVLYEAMRVGASGSAVLGTIHGDGGAAVRERVVTDLGVPESSFGATDLLVTLEPYESPTGRARRVKRIEEVVTADGVGFETLFELDSGELSSTGRIERGNSRLIDGLVRSTESYAAVRNGLDERTDWLADLADGGRTDPETIRQAHARRRAERTA